MQLNEQIIMQKAAKFIEDNIEAYIEDLAQIISIESIAAENAGENAPFGQPVAAALEKTLDISRRMGIEASNLNGFIGWAQLPGKSPNYLATIAHLDIVPPGEGWATNPYALLQKDGWLIGRGVEDNKGPAIMQLYIAKFFKQLNTQLPYTMRFIFGTNEETGMLDVPYYLGHFPQPLFCFTPDAEFPLSYGEKGVYSGNFVSPQLGGNIKAFAAGIASNVVPNSASCLVAANAAALAGTANISISKENGLVRIDARGIGGHAASPEGTVNAIGLIVEYLLANKLCNKAEEDFLRLLQKLHSSTSGSVLGIACTDDIFGPLTCIGGMLNLEEGRLVQNINCRLPTSTTAKDITAKLQQTAAANAAVFNVVSGEDAFHLNPKAAEMQLLLQAYNTVAGQNAQPFTMGGGTYARKFKNAAAFGPCFPGEEKPSFVGTIHGPNEGISIKTIKKAMQIYILALWRLQQLPDSF